MGTKKKINSRQKGAAGEREFANLLKTYGIEARRGQQFSGGKESPDVISDLPIHWEVKRVQKLDIHDAMAQAMRDAGNANMPVVAHRVNGKKWLVTMDAEMFIVFLATIRECIPALNAPELKPVRDL